MGCLLGHAWAQVPRGKPAANTAPARQTARFIEKAVIFDFLVDQSLSGKYLPDAYFFLERIPLKRSALCHPSAEAAASAPGCHDFGMPVW
jgi:hypothetical protein